MKSRRRIRVPRIAFDSARVVLCCSILHSYIAFTAPRAAFADSGNVEDILPLANDPNDPIGVERDPGFDRAAALNTRQSASSAPTPEDRARYGPTPPPFAAKSGEALTSVASVRELQHRVNLELSAGLALLDAELVFENTADKPAEVEYRLAVPDDAALAGLEACNVRGCRSGVLAPASERGAAYDDAVRARGAKPQAQQLPLAHAYKVRDARGAALIVRAAPVERDLPLTVRLRYATAAPVHGGVARLRLPARGMDPRAAPLELSLKASDLTAVQAGTQTLSAGAAAVRSDPWQPVEIRATQAGSGGRAVWQFPCGAQQCSRAYAVAPPRTAAASDLILAIDASPSTEGVARSRMLQAVSAILARAPQGTRVRALRFASKVESLVAERKDAAQLPLSAFGSVAYEAELGSATRFEAAWEVARSWGFAKNPQIVIVGDGGITRGKAKPFDAARRAGVEVSVVNVADRPTVPALADGAQLTGGTVIDAGAEADEAVRGSSAERLEERVSALFAPVAIPHPALAGLSGGARKLPALRAGESLTIEGLSRSSWTLQAGASARASAPPARLLLAMSVRGQERNHTATGGVLDAPSVALLAVDPRDLSHGGRDRPESAKGSCDRRGPAMRQGGLSSDAKPVALAAERTACATATKKPAKKPDAEEEGGSEIGAGMPSSPLLGMLRQRIIPVARGCFRKDRAGRADYQVRAVFAFELAEREVVSAEVTGKITEALRECLVSAIDGLAVPRFSGRVVVHYPLVTEKETLPSQIELTPEAAEKVDSLLTP